MLGKLRKVLGVLTDLLLVGRAKGWWSRKATPAPAEDRRTTDAGDMGIGGIRLR